MLVAQLTDTHVVADPSLHELYIDNNQRLRTAVAALNAESPKPELVLLTGDLTNTGTDDEYVVLAELLADLTIPALGIPGNHDTRDGVRAQFPDLDWADGNHASCIVDSSIPGTEGPSGAIRFIGLDSTTPLESGATFDDERRIWLIDAIHSAPGRVALALHHPPFLTGIEWMDDNGFVGLAELETVLTDHPVERILSGHIHRAIITTVAGIPAVTCPSSIHHVDLDLEPGAPISLILDPPSYLLHDIGPTSWVTHQRYFNTGEPRIHPGWA